MAEFSIKALPDTTFREGYVSPLDLLAIATQVNFDEFAKTRETFEFALEHIEVLAGEQWFPVKSKGRDVYMPLDIEKNYQALSQLCEWYVKNVIVPVFPASAE